MAGPYISLRKVNGKYQFIPEKLSLTSGSPAVAADLEEISDYNESLLSPSGDVRPHPEIKWKSIKATVKHDLADFGKSYVVSNIQFTE